MESALGLDGPPWRLIQQGLRNEGFDPGPPNGLVGPRTRAAIRRWQAARGASPTGYLDGMQAEVLRAAGAPRASVSGVSAAAAPRVAGSSAVSAPPANCRAWNT